MSSTNTSPNATQPPAYAIRFVRGQPEAPDGHGPGSEWLLTDARGGFAMGTASGIPQRRYHGLLCPSLRPPVCRVMMLTAIDEHLHIPGGGQCRQDLDVRLTPFQFAPASRPPEVGRFLTEFTKDLDSCRWTFVVPSQAGEIRIRRTLTMAQRGDACRVEYEIESSIHSPTPETAITLNLRPLLAMRDYHGINHPGTLGTDAFTAEPITEPAVEGTRVCRAGMETGLALRGVRLAYRPEPDIWRGVRYHHEMLRQMSDTEDLYCPGVFTTEIALHATASVGIEASVGTSPETGKTIDWQKSTTTRHARVRSSIDHALAEAGDPKDAAIRETIASLATAGDDFVVDRWMDEGGQTVSTSIIAGYPWFSDWGRDTMIALPGLLLTTGRHEEALGCLRTFAAARRHGLIPNRFDDAAGEAHFNTVDAPLWFIHACHQWSLAAGTALEPGLIDACDDIIDAYIRGTINRIGLDEADGLIRAGDANTQLTWMDAQREGIAFTPRHGKPIEINALWVNALAARARMGNLKESRADELELLATRARRSIITRMTSGPGGGLVDCLVPVSAVRSFAWKPSGELRPNQVFAMALPGVELPAAAVNRALAVLTRSLLTPVGLRTLDAGEESYQPHYTGSMMERDRAYHNGTVWPWLLGPYCEALLRIGGFDAPSRSTAAGLLMGMAERMRTDSVGQLFEIYDARPDEQGRHASNGCPAQAWSIAETLRVLVMSRPG
ncbi:MAG: amylo-alpha-1,6-glucosidase [Phycisphaerales bacterium]